MSCTGCNDGCFDESVQLAQGSTGQQGTTGNDGNDGNDGLNGIFGGFSMEFDFDSSNFSTPPLGEIRFNSATLSSVTEIFVSTTGTGSANAAPFLDSFDDNGDPGNYGLIRVFKQHDSPVFWLGKVIAIAPSGASRTLTVQYITSGSDPFNDGDDTIVSFVSNGADGLINSGVLDNYSILDDGLDYSSLTPVKVREFEIPANTFVKDKDEVSIDYGFSGDYFPLNLDIYTDNTVNGMYFLQVRVVQGATTRYVELLNDGALPITTVSTSWFPGGTCRLKLYKQAAGGLRPVLLSRIGSEIGTPNLEYPGNVQTTDPIAWNQERFLLSKFGSVMNGWYNTNNASIATIDGFDFTQAMDVEVYMWRGEFVDTSTIGGSSELPPGDRPDYNPRFRLMNLHASFNKVL